MSFDGVNVKLPEVPTTCVVKAVPGSNRIMRRAVFELVLDQVIVTESPSVMLVSLAEIVAVGSGVTGWLGHRDRFSFGHRAAWPRGP